MTLLSLLLYKLKNTFKVAFPQGIFFLVKICSFQQNKLLWLIFFESLSLQILLKNSYMITIVTQYKIINYHN